MSKPPGDHAVDLDAANVRKLAAAEVEHANGHAGGLSTRVCQDCVPPFCVQGGSWGWAAHRYVLHGEGKDPGPHPPPARPGKREGKPWTDAERAEFHRRRAAARRRAR